MAELSPDLLDALGAAVGAENVRTGDAINDDYTHDEALTAAPQRPGRRRPPGDDRRRWPPSSAWRPSTGSRSRPRGSGTGLSGACIPTAAASSCRSSG